MATSPKGKKPEPRKSPQATKPAAPKKAAGIGAPVHGDGSACIYALCDPVTGEVRYIGKANDPEKRLKSHLRDARSRRTPVYCWINKLTSNGEKPVLKVLEWATDWREAERRLITQYRESGARLLNVAEGGDEPACSYATRAANGKAVSQSRDKAIWGLRRKVGDLLAWLESHGRSAAAARLHYAYERFNTLSADKQRRVAIKYLQRNTEVLA